MGNGTIMKTHEIERFSSLSDLILKTKNVAGNETSSWGLEHPINEKSDWAGDTYDCLVGKLLNGVDTYTAKASKLASQIAEVELPSTRGSEARRDVFGSRLSVGEYSVGSPTCFRRRTPVQSDNMPIKVVVDMFISASFTTKQIEARGLAVLALVQKIMDYRQVELYVVCSTSDQHGYGFSAKGNYLFMFCEINSRPLDLATASVAICNAAISRRIFFAQMRTHDIPPSIPCPPNTQEFFNVRAKMLGLTENDIVINGARMGDFDGENAVTWVNNELESLKAKLDRLEE